MNTDHLAKLAKWLRCVLSTYLYGTVDCMFLLVWIHSETNKSHGKNIQANGKVANSGMVALTDKPIPYWKPKKMKV